ncbi:hypothetical protein P692DRAFT_201858760 [Suillus brevipes Sb2]|nr:hypothetical protein P692DRAFT_201858760 [Suillus brevipes Sb2]
MPSVITTGATVTANLNAGRVNRRTTASKPLLSTSQSIEEHEQGLGLKTNANNLTTARKVLTTHGLTLPFAGNMLHSISLAIFELSITANLGTTHTDILRALAIMINEVDKEIDTEHIIDKTKALMGGPVATLDEKVDALADMMDSHRAELEKLVVEVRNNLQTSTEGLEKMVENATEVTNQTTPATTIENRSNGPRSYADATRTNTSPPLTKLLARCEAQARQILIDRRSPLYANSLRELTEAQLVAKATMAVELMAKEKEDLPKDLSFISAWRLPHGGILYELESAEAAAWFNTLV